MWWKVYPKSKMILSAGMCMFLFWADFLFCAIICGHTWGQFKFIRTQKSGCSGWGDFNSWNLNKIQDVDFWLINKRYFQLYSCSGVHLPVCSTVWHASNTVYMIYWNEMFYRYYMWTQYVYYVIMVILRSKYIICITVLCIITWENVYEVNPENQTFYL